MDNASSLAETGNVAAVYADRASLFRIIDDARKARRIGDKELAEAAGIAAPSYSRLKTRAEGPSAAMLQKLLGGLVKLAAIDAAEKEALAARIAALGPVGDRGGAGNGGAA